MIYVNIYKYIIIIINIIVLYYYYITTINHERGLCKVARLQDCKVWLLKFVDNTIKLYNDANLASDQTFGLAGLKGKFSRSKVGV